MQIPMPMMLKATLLALSTLTGAVMAQEVASPSPEIIAKIDQRLATVLTRYARTVMGTNPLSVEGIDAATALLQDAVQLDPEQAQAWSILQELAMMTDRPALVAEATSALIRIRPEDSAARLERLLVALEQAHTVDARDQLVRSMLSGDNLALIGADVGSRLALRMALLERRSGNVTLFHQWLQRAIALDPTNQEAASLIIGIESDLAYRDPPAWTRMLIQLLLLNPTDSGVSTELGFYLFDHGAYAAAARLFMMSRAIEAASGRDSGSDLDADLIMSLWAAGDDAAAQRVLEERQVTVNELFRQIAMEGDPSGRNAVEISRLTGPMSPKLAMIHVLMAAKSADPAVLTDALDELSTAIDHRDRARETDGVDVEGRAHNYRRLLVFLALIDASPGMIEQARVDLEKLEPLTPDQNALLDALLGKDHDGRSPEAILNEQAPNSALARVGLAQLLQKQGRLREAGQQWLAAWRSGPGTMLGVYAARQLASLLGTHAELDEVARTMTSMVDALPSALFRLPEEPTLAVSLSVEPRERTVDPYEPMLLDIRVFNHTAEPLAINPLGPIEDLVIVEPQVMLPYLAEVPPAPVLVDIQRVLRVEPHDSLSVTLDLQTTWVGELLSNNPLYGAQIETETILNPRVATASSSPKGIPVVGPLGSVATSEDMRMNGQRVSEVWIREVLERVLTRESHEELVDMAMLSHVLAHMDAVEKKVEMSQDLAAECVAALVDAWPRLDPPSQAWLASALSFSDRLDQLWSMVESNTDPTVQRVVLMRLVGRFDNPGEAAQEPVVVGGLTSDNPAVQSLAEWIEATLQLAAEQQFRSQNEESP